ncbi:MAG TPA: hypothetical protein QF403_04755 [Alphaproteobacteria bacterium]|jgi:hypothetical protein|nr:hypothetical protein [Alphaproteobacteria bacterium]
MKQGGIFKRLRERPADAGRKTAQRFSLPVIAWRYGDFIEDVAQKVTQNGAGNGTVGNVPGEKT